MKTILLVFLFSVSPLAAQTPDERIAALEARVTKLETLIAKLTAAPAPAAQKPAGMNKYGIPDSVLAKIKASVEARYPDNFSMQKTLIEAQVKDYKDLQEK